MFATERNKRRIARMNIWISHAEKAAGDDDTHLRFLFYWIAYEAAYQTDRTYSGVKRKKDWEKQKDLHRNLAMRDKGRLQGILLAQKDDVLVILKLRQADRAFWTKGMERNDGVETPEEWNRRFRERVRSTTKRLDAAVGSGVKRAVRETLNDVFENLNVVRNQIVHGASAGPESRGRTQVIAGAELLSALVPCFRDSIQLNIRQDWGKPPFPRVGEEPDDECPPPWLPS